jgi:membrane complex biogenesis BtpA family protein
VTIDQFRALFQTQRPLIGMVHLGPLPGAPRHAGDLAPVLAQARADAELLEGSGFHGLVVENFHDAPFFPDRVPPETVAAMAVAVREVMQIASLPVGVNVLRNDGAAALGIAAATGAAFVRVNVLTGAMVTDQGLIEGRAHELLRLRRALGTATFLFADVLVKHARPLGVPSVAQVAEETVGRGLADALIVSGAGSGKAADLGEVRLVREAAPGVPVLLGSGVTARTVRESLEAADGVIVGSDLEQEGRPGAPLDPERVAAFCRAYRTMG